MFSIGLPEFVVLLLITLIFVGPERLPQVARWMGKNVAKGRRMLAELQREIERDADLSEVRKAHGEIREEIQGLAAEFKDVGEEWKRAADEVSSLARGEGDGPADEDEFGDEEALRAMARPAPGSVPAGGAGGSADGETSAKT